MKPPVQARPAPPAPKPVASLILFADCFPDGAGGFLVKPRPPRSLMFSSDGKRVVQEIGAVDACRVLSVSRAEIHNLLTLPGQARKIIKYRFTSKRRGKRMFDVASLLEYIEFTKTLED